MALVLPLLLLLLLQMSWKAWAYIMTHQQLDFPTAPLPSKLSYVTITTTDWQAPHTIWRCSRAFRALLVW
jgi:hypothetical protein